MNENTKQRKQRTTITSILLIVLVVSLLIGILWPNLPSTTKTVTALKDKQIVVTRLMGGAALVSTTLTLIPGDTAMPVANQLAELSSFFLIILGALLLEKILYLSVGVVSLMILIPFACVLEIIYQWYKVDLARSIALKSALFGLVICISIPLSLYASDAMYLKYNSNVEHTIDTVSQNKKYTENKKDTAQAENINILDKVKDLVTDTGSKIYDGTNEAIKKGEDALANIFDTIALFIVTTCLIPIGIIWLIYKIAIALFAEDPNGYKRFSRKRGLDSMNSKESPFSEE